MSLRVNNGNIQVQSTPRQGLKPLGVNNGQVKPLQINNGQVHTPSNLKNIKVTAKADSTGVENSNQGPVLIKHHHSVKKPQTPSVARRNARERNRVKVVNSGFDILKTHVPHLKSKVSKVETLKAAVDYIKALKEMLGEKVEMDGIPMPNILPDDHDDLSLDMDTSHFHQQQQPINQSQQQQSINQPQQQQDSRINSSTDIQNLNLNPMVYELPSTPSIIYQPMTTVSIMCPSSSPGTQQSIIMSPTTVSSAMNQSLSPSEISEPSILQTSPILSTSICSGDEKPLLLPTISTLAPSTIILSPGSRLPSITAPSWWPQITQLTAPGSSNSLQLPSAVMDSEGRIHTVMDVFTQVTVSEAN